MFEKGINKIRGIWVAVLALVIFAATAGFMGSTAQATSLDSRFCVSATDGDFSAKAGTCDVRPSVPDSGRYAPGIAVLFDFEMGDSIRFSVGDQLIDTFGGLGNQDRAPWFNFDEGRGSKLSDYRVDVVRDGKIIATGVAQASSAKSVPCFDEWGICTTDLFWYGDVRPS